MSTQNEIMKLKGFDLPGNICELQREQPFSDQTSGKHFGMPISTYKFLQMLYDFWLSNRPGSDNPFSNVWWVDFSKASLFRILAQEDCEYIRFYFAKPDQGINRASLALEGIKTNGNPIKLKQILAVASTMNGETNVDPESLGNDIVGLAGGTFPPDNEEKGNGGPQLDNKRNISSLKEFFDSLGEDFKEKSFEQFIDAYYKHAQKNFS